MEHNCEKLRSTTRFKEIDWREEFFRREKNSIFWD